MPLLVRRALGTLVPGGALIVLVALLLPWSHQISTAEHARFHGPVLFAVARHPNALQVYAIAGELLAALAIVAAAVSIRGGTRARLNVGVATGLGTLFVLHAATHPPTNGLLLAGGVGAAARYVPDPATAGSGETLALVGLLAILLGTGAQIAMGRRFSSVI